MEQATAQPSLSDSQIISALCAVRIIDAKLIQRLTENKWDDTRIVAGLRATGQEGKVILQDLIDADWDVPKIAAAFSNCGWEVPEVDTLVAAEATLEKFLAGFHERILKNVEPGRKEHSPLGLPPRVAAIFFMNEMPTPDIMAGFAELTDARKTGAERLDESKGDPLGTIRRIRGKLIFTFGNPSAKPASNSDHIARSIEGRIITKANLADNPSSIATLKRNVADF